jgi:hypothetical protein
LKCCIPWHILMNVEDIIISLLIKPPLSSRRNSNEVKGYHGTGRSKLLVHTLKASIGM